MTIGIIAPSSPLRPGKYERGLQYLQDAGYRVVLGDHIHESRGYLAGTDAHRAADLTAMFAQPDIHAVFCACGGYGSGRILDLIDWEIVNRFPKTLIGFSDVTSLLSAFQCRTRQVVIHGPMLWMLGNGLSDAAEKCFWHTLQSDSPQLLDTRSGQIETLVSGNVTGRLTGGSLTLLTSAVGTRDLPDFEGKIVLLEDIGSAVYQADRCLIQLRRAGILERAAGFIIGELTDWMAEEKELRGVMPRTLWEELIAPQGKPTIVGFPFGHVQNPLTIPLGCLAELDADAGALTLLEPAVV